MTTGTEDRLIIRAGTLLIFDHGEYSDFGYTGPFRVEKEIDRKREADAYRAQWKPGEHDWRDGPNYSDFVPWLLREGFIADVDATSWYIGSYGEFTPE